MNLGFFSQHFFPETIRINDIVFGLSKKYIFESLGYLLLIFFSSTIIGGFESFLVFFESQFTETVPSVQELTITNTKSLVQQNQDPVAITKRCSN